MKQQKIVLLALWAFALALFVTVGFDGKGALNIQLGRTALADITVTKARIGCLDVQKDGNLTALVGQACNHRMTCAYKAPTEDALPVTIPVANKRSLRVLSFAENRTQ